jgi:hypothetical protein
LRNAIGRRVTYTLSDRRKVMMKVTLLLASAASGQLVCGMARARAESAGGVD